MSAADILVAARAELVIHGWTQGLFEAEDGAPCMLGALRKADGCNPSLVHRSREAERAYFLLCDAVGDRWPADFNDDDDRTLAEVLDAYDRAITLAKERGL